MYGKLLDRSRKALVYDAALRREELCALEAGNIQPTHRLLRVSFRTALDRSELEGLGANRAISRASHKYSQSSAVPCAPWVKQSAHNLHLFWVG